jgi:hypothetical protein
MPEPNRKPSVSFRLDEQLKTRIENYADRHDINRTEAITGLIEFGLEVSDGPRSDEPAENEELRKQLEASQYHLNQLDKEINQTLEAIDGDS